MLKTTKGRFRSSIHLRMNPNLKFLNSITGDKKVFRPHPTERGLAKIVAPWDIQKKTAPKGQERLELNTQIKKLQQMM